MNSKQLEAKCRALEKIVIELALIAYDSASRPEKDRLDSLLEELQDAGEENAAPTN